MLRRLLRRHRTLLLVAMLCLSSTNCRRSPGALRTEQVTQSLEQADGMWADLARVDRLEQTVALLGEAYEQAPDDPEVLWRLSRAHVSLGLAASDPQTALGHYGQARAIGLQCLDGNESFRQLRRSRSWKAAVDRLEPRLAACETWMTWGWIRWIAVYGGEAAALDIPRVNALFQHIRDQELADDGMSAWMSGVWTAVQPDVNTNELEKAKRTLLRAVRQSPHDLSRRVDLLEWVGVPLEDRDLFRTQSSNIRSRQERISQEDAGAVDRLDRLTTPNR